MLLTIPIVGRLIAPNAVHYPHPERDIGRLWIPICTKYRSKLIRERLAYSIPIILRY